MGGIVSLIQEQLEEIRVLCREYHVAQLYVFGSAANGTFRPGESDIDFLVTLTPSLTPHEHRVAYFGLIEALETLFQTHVDLVEEPSIRNPYFREEVEETRMMLYAA
ncbi:MAG TPA: nucleotidyltransferase domain-containing protein [Armatimonadota bacterium]|nr:nucleotidyltransferase domain-containing protein [Armatimonadota bacterium]